MLTQPAGHGHPLLRRQRDRGLWRREGSGSQAGPDTCTQQVCAGQEEAAGPRWAGARCCWAVGASEELAQLPVSSHPSEVTAKGLGGLVSGTALTTCSPGFGGGGAVGSRCRLHPMHIPKLLPAPSASWGTNRPSLGCLLGESAAPWPCAGALAESGAPSAYFVLTATRRPGSERTGCPGVAAPTAAPGLLLPATPRPLPSAQAWTVAAAAPRAAWTSDSRAWRFGGAPGAGGPAGPGWYQSPSPPPTAPQSLCARPGSRPHPARRRPFPLARGDPLLHHPFRGVCVWLPYLTPGTDPPRPPSCPAPMTGRAWALGGPG